MSVFFIGGIHGSGKTTLCQQLAPRLGATHLTASQLIRFRPEPGDPTKRAVTNVAENQQRLVEALERYRANEALLLDGHYCLVNQKGQITRIPIETFERIAPRAMILVQADPDVIAHRLKDRPGEPYDRDFISAFAAAEKSYAQEVSASTSAPLLLWEDGAKAEAAIEFLQRYL